MSVTATAAVTAPLPVDERVSRRAGLRRRYAASMVDSLLLSVAVSLAASVATSVAHRSHSVAVTLIVYVALAGTALVGYPLVTMTRRGHAGQTVGKQLLGIRVVDRSGGHLTLRALVLREVVGKLLLGTVTFGVFMLVSALCAVMDGERRSLHDRMAGTLVVNA